MYRLSDLKQSEPHKMLLSRFLNGSSLENIARDPRWADVLREEPAIAVQKFVDAGLLEPASTIQKLSADFGVANLKKLLKDRGLKQSGSKLELAERLVEHDEPGMLSIVSDSRILICAGDGRVLAEEYLALKKDEKLRLERSLYLLLESGDLSEAAKALATYESSQVFPRGMGMNWDDAAPQLTNKLGTIFREVPTMLNRESDDAISHLKLAAGMMELFGTGRARKWLPHNIQLRHDIDPEAAARMFVFHARHLERLAQLKEAGFRKVKVIGLSDSSHCANCQKINGRTYKIENAPELPYPQCSCVIGCRCLILGERPRSRYD